MIIFVVLLSFFNKASAAASYSIVPGWNYSIYGSNGAYYDIYNACGVTTFAPNATYGEWIAFATNKPACITLYASGGSSGSSGSPGGGSACSP